jgi:Carboxypeptidase regulatory-like domain
MSSTRNSSREAGSPAAYVPARLTWLCLTCLFCGSVVLGQTEASRGLVASKLNLPDSPTPKVAIEGQQEQRNLPGSIAGRVVGQDGKPLAGTKVKLVLDDQPGSKEVLTDDDGRFTFTDIAPGSFQLTVTSEGFAANTSTGTLHIGETLTVPQVTLVLPTAITKVEVQLSPIEIAQEQMNDEMKQRVLGVIPNFYVTYVPDAAPLTTKQKFKMNARLSFDPAYFVLTGAVAGVQQARNEFSGYGQGAEGYAKRYGATFADFTISNFLGNAVFPSLFKQDPRYFYKGKGSTKSRVLYALANAVICKGDNRHWQANYSGILGSLVAGGISNLYYPESDRSAGLTFENTAIGIGGSAILNLMKEFVLTKITTNVPGRPDPANPNAVK